MTPRRYPLTKACAICGSIFTPAPAKRLRQKTCSSECASLSRVRSNEKNKSLVGLRFGRLLVIDKAEVSRFGNRKYWCECSCGTKKSIFQQALVSGGTKSCGCLRKETTCVCYCSGEPALRICNACYRRARWHQDQTYKAHRQDVYFKWLQSPRGRTHAIRHRHNLRSYHWPEIVEVLEALFQQRKENHHGRRNA